LEKTDEAEGILKSIKDSNNNFASFMLIVLALEQKEWDSVIKCSEEIIKNSDKDIYYYSALYYKAAAEKQSGKGTGSFATTQKLLQEACSENAGLLDLYAFRALCYKEIGELDKALDMVNYILNLEPQAGEAYMIRAMIYKAKGDDVRAASDEKTAKEKSPLLSSVKLDSGE
jgi:tetratricopeptide (TPR) repeat protein